MRLTSIRGERAEEPAAAVMPVLEELATGRPILVIDEAADRGWFVCAAEQASTDFIVRAMTYGRGVVRVAMEDERLRRLGVPSIEGGAGLHVPVDLRGAERGTTSDQVATLRALADPLTYSEDIVVPGHVFPIEAGECVSPNDTCIARAMLEAARLAGCEPVAAYAEAVDEQGSPADRAATGRLARRLGMKLTSVRDVLIHRERVAIGVSREVETAIPTPAGRLRALGYQGKRTGAEYVVFMSVRVGDGARVHLHHRCQISDVFGGVECGCGRMLARSLDEIHHSDNGLVIYYGAASGGLHATAPRIDWPTVAEIAGVLRDLGAERVFMSSNQPIPTKDLAELGIAVTASDVDVLARPPRRVSGL